ncbi:unnamed protein product [Amoebophrya sp. A120]|nr:unnamed protein product [Amoebophrya sp. A120]|eukprot:GSA120T00024539001.1
MTMSRRGQQQQHAQVVHQMKNKTTTWSTTAALHCVVVFTSLTGFLPASVDAVFNPLSSDYLDRILNKCRETGGVRFPNTVNATDFTQICRKKNMRFAIGENEGDLETTSNGPLAFSGTVTTASSLTKAFRKLDFGDDHDGATSARCWIRCGTGSATYQAFAAELPFAGGTEGAAQDGDVVTVTRKGYGINGEGIKYKSVWVWKNATCDAAFGFQKNLYCMSTKRNVIFATWRGHLSCGIGIRRLSKNL